MKSMNILHGSGYLFVFLPWLIFTAGREFGIPLAMTIAFFCILPFFRLVLGSSPRIGHEWTERQSLALDWLARVYVLGQIGFMGWVLHDLHTAQLGTLQTLLYAVDLAVVFGLSYCVAHSLVHSKAHIDQDLGVLSSALSGCPFLRGEHIGHHAMPQDIEHARCPRRGQSIYSFAWNWLKHSPREAYYWHAEMDGRSKRVNRAVVGWLLTVSMLVAFGVVAGVAGVLVYAVAALVANFIMAGVNYLQHWGLGDDTFPDATHPQQVGWEDDCRLETYMVFGLNHHSWHHRKMALPYYMLESHPQAPRLPASYSWCFLAALVPPLWRRMMTPILARWLTTGEKLESPGKGLFCFRIDMQGRALAKTAQDSHVASSPAG